jgi:AcrR family transcriptional regulator
MKIQRRNPKQARARATCEAILEAASQILERDGAAGFNTNAVAERAGVSIGTLYQYFPDKTAILLAAAQREAALAEPNLASRPKALLHALIAFLDTLSQGAAASRAQIAARTASAPKSRRRGGSVVIRLRWTPPAAWLWPLLTPVWARARPRWR